VQYFEFLVGILPRLVILCVLEIEDGKRKRTYNLLSEVQIFTCSTVLLTLSRLRSVTIPSFFTVDVYPDSSCFDTPGDTPRLVLWILLGPALYGTMKAISEMFRATHFGHLMISEI